MKTTEAKPKNGHTYTAIVYARTSGGDDAEDKADGSHKVSHLTQRLDGKDLADKRSWTVLAEIEDKKRSGRTYPTDAENSPLANDGDFAAYFATRIKAKKRYSRDGLSEVLQLLPKADYLIIRDITRLCRPYRNSFLLNYLWQTLRKHSVTIVLHNGSEIKPTDEMLKAVQGMLLSFEDDSMEEKYEAHIRSVELNREAGKIYCCANFYGFKKESLEIGTVERQTEELAIVSEIFRLYLEDTALGEICRTLNASNRYTRHGKLWSRESVKAILSRPQYCGFQYGSKDMDGNRTLVKAIPFLNYAIVTRDQWELVRARLQEQTKYTAQKEKLVIHPLSGLVFCGNCGKRMQLRRKNARTPEYYYVCEYASDYTTKDTDIACKMSAISERYKGKVNDMEYSPTGLLECLRPLLSCQILEHLKAANGTNEAKQRQAALEIKAAEIERKQAHLVSLLNAEVLDEPDFNASAASLKVNREALTKEREALQTELAERFSLFSTLSEWNAAMYQGLTPVTERRLFNATIARVTVYPYHVRVCLKNRKCFHLTRYLKGNARLLPSVSFFYNDEAGKTPVVIYGYHTEYDKAEVLYKDSTIEVLANGIPKKPSRSALLQDSVLFERLYTLPQTSVF